jgi:cell division transport system ATP-binding protein
VEGAERPDVSGETYQKTFESKTRRERQRRSVESSERATLRARRPRLEIPLIYFNNVSKVYGRDTVALDQVNLGIEAGEFVFLVGASGSGKSTMVRLILKELEPSAGSIHVNGVKLSAIPRRYLPKHRRNIGCVFQDFKLLPNKTAAENVAYAMEVTGQKRRAISVKVPQILDLVGLREQMDKYPDQLSGGEQQRVSVARAFVGQPPILVADEPTGNLDPDTSVGIMQLLHRINRIGTTVVVATHDREMVDVMRKRVVALDAGRIVRDKARGIYADEV